MHLETARGLRRPAYLSELITWQGAARQAQVKAKTVYYALCAKVGYTDELTQLAREEPGLYLFALE